MTSRIQEILFFETPDGFRRWLHRHHARADELWVGFRKRATGLPSLTWPESVDEALCYGWIDGLRKSIDDASYKIRFTPRRPGSTWSLINIRRVAELTALGRMRPAGLAAFERRKEAHSGIYSYEQRNSAELPPAYVRQLRANKRAWAYLQSQPPWYQRNTARWVMSAKQEATRERRLAHLITQSAAGEPIGSMKYSKR